MKKSTINKLNQLNKEFYSQTAEYFSQTRQYFWSGWHNLLPYLEKISAQNKDFKVLDLGCGNGRFGLFLAGHLDADQFDYYGVDSSQPLLDIAKDKLGQTKIKFQLKKIDLVEGLLKGGPEINQQFDLIVGFGLMHHIPGFDLRRKLFEFIEQNLKKQGIGVITLWQFGQKKRFQRKGIAPKKVSLNPKELDENDYILDWRRGGRAYRYCHFVDQQEKIKLIDNSGLKLADEFLADGETENLNKYLILTRK